MKKCCVGENDYSSSIFQNIKNRQNVMTIRTTPIHNQCKLCPASRRAGFTLVEVIIVVAVIGILSAIAYPAMLQWLPSIRVKAATQQLYSDLQRARSLAIKNNTIVRLTFVVSPGCNGATSYTFTDSNAPASFNPITQTMTNNVCLKDSTFTNGTSGFSPRGIPAGAIGSVTVGHSQTTRQRTVTQTMSGSLRMD